MKKSYILTLFSFAIILGAVAHPGSLKTVKVKTRPPSVIRFHYGFIR
jgi:hypothetical protein